MPNPDRTLDRLLGEVRTLVKIQARMERLLRVIVEDLTDEGVAPPPADDERPTDGDPIADGG